MKPFDPAKVQIEHKRFSETQGEVLISYDGVRIEQYGDKIQLVGSEWVGLSDAEWIAVARREALARNLACLSPEEKMIETALESHAAAALAQWEKDGRADCGSCGGIMLGYRGNTRFAKAMLAMGVGSAMGGVVFLSAKLPEEIRSQHDAIEIRAGYAFRSAVVLAGGPEPSKIWTYVD